MEIKKAMPCKHCLFYSIFQDSYFTTDAVNPL